MSDSTPLWRQMFNSWEKAVAPNLEELTSSTGFRDLLAVGLKANADLTRELERASRQWLHLWNLPAATDVRRLRKQVTSLERELVALRFQIEQAAMTGGAPTTSRPSSPVVGLAKDANQESADESAAA